MSRAIIIQARMTSQRLPGKVLLTLRDRPLLGHLLDRLRNLNECPRIIVATTRDREDDPLEAFCCAEHVACERGDRDDVAGRFLQAAQAHGIESIVRLCADSPLVDVALLQRMIDVASQHPGILVTNVQPRTFPRGQSIEIVPTAMLAAAHPHMADPADREHVLPFLYRRSAEFPSVNVAAGRDRSELRLCVDTEDDLQIASAIFGLMEHEPWTYSLEQILHLSERALAARHAAMPAIHV